MSAQASGGAGGDEKKPNKASKCKICGNRHEGACWPKCDTCGKRHQGICRYANPTSSVGLGNAGQEPSMTALFNSQQAGLQAGHQAGHQAGYQQAYNEMRLSSIRPGMGPIMGGPVYVPVGGFISPYAGQYGGYVRPVTPGWNYPVPSSFGQAYAGFPSPAFGQGTFGAFGAFGNASQPTSSYAGIRKPTSRRARGKAKKKASEKKKKMKEETPQDPESARNGSATVVDNEQTQDVAHAQENVGTDFSIIDAQSLIEEATRIPSGFQFPQDQARVETIANSLALFGQHRFAGLSETATANSTSIVWEAFQEEL